MSALELAYFEDLAATGIICPHEDAFRPDGLTPFYRYIKGGVVFSESFLPTTLNPDLPLPKGCDNCIQKSVSVYDDLQSLINGVFKLPHNKGKKKTIGRFCIAQKDGMLKQTFGKGHHSWWRAKDFDITNVTIQEITV
jgi:hypothetical protein